MFNKGFQTGKSWGHEERVHESTTSDSNLVPPLYLMVKDHKEVKEGELPKQDHYYQIVSGWEQAH